MSPDPARLQPDLLADTGISFGMHVGKTPGEESEVAGMRLPSVASRADGDWTQALFGALSRDEIAWQLAGLLATPAGLSMLPEQLKGRVKRPVSEEANLAWPTPGATARQSSRTLLRPVVHAFLRGSSSVNRLPGSPASPGRFPVKNPG